METKKTSNLEQFKFRNDNRAKIDYKHVKRLVESIKSRNLLDMRPILVNEKMEIIDGQNRVLAAKELGVDIYYNIDSSFKGEDIILMNIQKSWRPEDYFNYYIKNGHEEYLKLYKLMQENDINLTTALCLTMGKNSDTHHLFKTGKYVHQGKFIESSAIYWDTINYIKTHNGAIESRYTSTARFWRALHTIFSHPDFDETQWRKNLPKLVNKFDIRAQVSSYIKIMDDVYNYRNNHPIAFAKEKE